MGALLFLTAGALGGCGYPASDGSDSGVTLTIAGGWGPEKKVAMEAALRNFHKSYPHVLVKPINVTGGSYYDKVEVMIAGGSAPDVMWMGQGFATFAARGAFLSVNDLYDTIDRDEYLGEVLDWYRIDGDFYGFPCGVCLGCIVYNKDLFDEAGVPYPDENWTLDEFVGVAQTLTRDIDGDGRVDQWGFVGNIPRGTFGARLLNDEHTKCLLDSPESVRSLQFNIDLYRKHRVSPPPEGDSVASMGTEMSFVLGRVAMWSIAAGQIVPLRRQINTFDWDIALTPIGKQRAHWTSSRGWAIANSTKHPEEAVALLKAMAGEIYALELQGITLPVKRAAAEELIRNWKGPPKSIGLLIKMTESMDPNPRVPNISEVMTIHDRHRELAALGKVTAEIAMRNATNEINAVLEEERRQAE